MTTRVYLSRRNLLTLISKLNRQARGERTACMLIKRDYKHSVYPQSEREIEVVAVEDEDYYLYRSPGWVYPDDDPWTL